MGPFRSFASLSAAFCLYLFALLGPSEMNSISYFPHGEMIHPNKFSTDFNHRKQRSTLHFNGRKIPKAWRLGMNEQELALARLPSQAALTKGRNPGDGLLIFAFAPAFATALSPRCTTWQEGPTKTRQGRRVIRAE